MRSSDEVIAEFREHLLAGRFGDRELLMPAERDYAGMWSGLCDALVQLQDRYGFDNPVVHEIRTTMNRLADQRPDAVRVFALATTRYGREDALD